MKTQFCRLFWHISYCKKQQSNFIAKCDRLLLQSASVWQVVITKFDTFCLILEWMINVIFCAKRDQPYWNVRWNSWLHAFNLGWERTNCCFFFFLIEQRQPVRRKNELKNVRMRPTGEKEIYEILFIYQFHDFCSSTFSIHCC